MRDYLRSELVTLRLNVINGTKLALFRKSALTEYRGGLDQVVLLFLLNTLLVISAGYIYYLPDPEFNIYGINGIGIDLLGILLIAFITAKLAKDNNVVLYFLILLYSTFPIFTITWLLFIVALDVSTLYYLYIFWGMTVVFYILFHLTKRSYSKTILSSVIYIAIAILPNIYLSSGEFWYAKQKKNSYLAAYEKINQEDIYYKQGVFMDNFRKKLLPSRKNITDMYFIGFGSYAMEDVFMKEIQYIRDLMDESFDTEGRSISLINNLKTMDATPLATKSNLSQVLKHMGKIMDPEEDVLYLYLTSHGSKTHELSVRFWPLKLNQVNPVDLKNMLNEAGIKWRVLLVSSCYSGGFIDPLKNDNTLIMTASSQDRTSFGCGSKSDFTYFGEAVFVEQLSNNYSFISAFENAKKSILEREKKENLKPSMPQLYVGDNIREKLDSLENELDKFYAESSESKG